MNYVIFIISIHLTIGSLHTGQLPARIRAGIPINDICQASGAKARLALYMHQHKALSWDHPYLGHRV